MARTKAFDRDIALEKAMIAFWKCGYEATSMQDLVDAMGINRQSLYDTYGDKHELYLEALERYRCSEAVLALYPLDEPKPIRQRLEKMFDLMIEDSIHDKDRKGCFIANATLERASQDKAVKRFVENNFEQSLVKFEAVFLDAQRKGELSKEKNAKSLAAFIVSAIAGLRVTAKTAPDREVLKSVVKTTLAALE